MVDENNKIETKEKTNEKIASFLEKYENIFEEQADVHMLKAYINELLELTPPPVTEVEVEYFVNEGIFEDRSFYIVETNLVSEEDLDNFMLYTHIEKAIEKISFSEEEIVNLFYNLSYGFEIEITGDTVILLEEDWYGKPTLVAVFGQKLARKISEKYPDIITEELIDEVSEDWDTCRGYL